MGYNLKARLRIAKESGSEIPRLYTGRIVFGRGLAPSKISYPFLKREGD